MSFVSSVLGSDFPEVVYCRRGRGRDNRQLEGRENRERGEGLGGRDTTGKAVGCGTRDQEMRDGRKVKRKRAGR